MTARGEETQGRNGDRRPIVYCVVPRDLARLYEPLRRHFRDGSDIEVIIERRACERRSLEEQREAAGERKVERRKVRNLGGRRVGERRAALMAVGAPVDLSRLPLRARRHAERLSFVERLEPSSEHSEDLDTARLVTRIQAGEGGAFDDLYMRYFDRVYGYLKLTLANRDETEDAVQEVFAKVLQHLPVYERRDQPFRAWLFRIVRNHALDRLRERQRIDVTSPEQMQHHTERAAADEHIEALGWISDRELMLFIERLPLAQRQVLMLRYMLGLRGSEIADLLGRSHDDVRSLQHRALRFLRDRLTAIGREPPRSGKVRMRGVVRKSRVLRYRRFALY